jgi:hypothetical protein
VRAEETTAASIDTAGLKVEVAEFCVTAGAVTEVAAIPVLTVAVVEMGVADVGVDPEAAVVVEVGVAVAVSDNVQLMVARPWVILFDPPGLVKS